MRTAPAKTKRIVAIALAAVLVLTLAFVAATSGLGAPGIPSGAVAIVDGVDDGTVTEEQFQAALEQAAAQQGLKEVPAADPSDDAYTSLRDQAMQTRLLAIWVEGETADRGITVTQDEIDAELARAKKESFSSPEEFQQFLTRSKFTEEDINQQIKLGLLRDELEATVVPSEQTEDPANPGQPRYTADDLADFYGVDEGAIEDFYDANGDVPPLAVPASRDVRIILNTSQAKVEQAKGELEADDSAASWKKVAAKYSQDQASKDRGGLLEQLTEGQNDPQLEEQAFAAPEGELVGPFETDRGFYLIQVESITEAGTLPLKKASPQIKAQLIGAAQQQASNDFQTDFLAKWSGRTECAPEATIELCANFEAPVADPVEGQPVPPPVIGPAPIAPGTATITADGSAGQGAIQRPRSLGDECATPEEVEAATTAGTLVPGVVLEPCGPDDEIPQPDPAAAGALPPGAVPIGPDGAPAPGAAPPPPGAAPPPAGAAPPPAGAAPPPPGAPPPAGAAPPAP